ncbi:E3 ubiquitin-protein ligase RAD18 isoform X2 [Xylocopa sonorina]|uniref:E3 ubiquitin-protein ligase RAD18 isoform X2 n=1 Tax=Xylocopa sonorina TaxID=1818115 RepID=UPI00403B1B76
MWPKEYIELKRIEDLLLCGICYEFMNTAVMTSCSHSYCSLCIRKYLHHKTQCPTCFTDTFEPDLRKNKVLDEIIMQFSQIKAKLQRTLQIQVQFGKFNEIDNLPSTPKSLHQNNDTCTNIENKFPVNKVINNTPTSKINTSPSVQKDIFSPSTSGRPKIPLMFTPKSSKRMIVMNVDEKVVMCPVCKVNVSELHINRHLDDCLRRESVEEKPQIVEPSTRKPLPKLVVSLMKDAVLKKKLKEFGLSSQGERKVMEARLHRYIVLYNAECDKSNPRSVSELIKQCEDEENLEKKMNKTTYANRLQVTRNSEQNVIEDERKKYLEIHKDSFETLIKKIKSVECAKKLSAQHKQSEDNINNEDDVPLKCRVVAKSLDDSMTHNEKNDPKPLDSATYIQDSDSDTSCPLQMYSSTDPKKFLSVELPSSDDNDSSGYVEAKKEESVGRFVLSHHPTTKIEKAEGDNNSDASDTSIYEKPTQSIMEDSYHNATLDSDASRNSSNMSKYQKLLHRKQELPLNDEGEWIDVACSSVRDTDSDSVLDQEEEENEKSKSILQDISYDLSSNDSIDMFQ